MMLPPITCSPPNFLTPRRRPSESRPLRDEPPDFLCAICRSPYLFGAVGSRLRLGGGNLLRSGFCGRLNGGFLFVHDTLGHGLLGGGLGFRGGRSFLLGLGGRRR